MFPNITQSLILQTALQVLIESLSSEIGTHTSCILSTQAHDQDHFWEDRMEAPNVRMECDPSGLKSKEFDVTKGLVMRLMWGINNGCAYFLVSPECLHQFLDIFERTHFYSMSKYEKKVLIVLGDGKNVDVESVLNEKVIKNELPLTLLIQPPNLHEMPRFDDTTTIDIYCAFPFSQIGKIRNRFFIANASFEHHSKLIPSITDLEGASVRSGMIEFPPFMSGTRVPPGKGNANVREANQSLTLMLGGQEGSILAEFCRKFNCIMTCQFDYGEDLWGAIYPNHTGKGLLGAVAYNEVEVAAGSFYLVLSRYNYGLYTYVIQMSRVTHALPKPKPLPYWYTPILPFTPVTWGCFIASLVIGAASLILLDRGRLKVFPESKVKKKSVINALMSVLKISLNQNVTVLTNAGSSLIMYSFFMIFALTLGSFYVGGLSSLMTVTPTEKPIDTIQQLVQTHLEWGTTSITFVYPVQQSTDPAFVQYVKKFKVHAVTEFHKIVKKQKAAVIVETMQGGTLSYQAYIDRNDSKFLMVQKDPLYTAWTGIITTKTWPYMEQLNRIVFMQAESGIGVYWEHKSAELSTDFLIQKNIEENSRNLGSLEPVKLSVSHILGPLFLLLFGNLIGFVTFLLELMWGDNKRLLRMFRSKFLKVFKIN